MVCIVKDALGQFTHVGCVWLQVLQGGKAGQATLFLPPDEDKLEAAAQLVIGAAAIYDESFASITGAQVSSCRLLCSPKEILLNSAVEVQSVMRHDLKAVL